MITSKSFREECLTAPLSQFSPTIEIVEFDGLKLRVGCDDREVDVYNEKEFLRTVPFLGICQPEKMILIRISNGHSNSAIEFAANESWIRLGR